MSVEEAISNRTHRRLGTFFSERYRISRLIGTGGMSAVYAGVHRTGHAVAIKVLHERLSADPDVERLFRREALLANKIQHPGVVPVIDDGVAGDGCIFLVMPLLEGETLRARAQRTGNKLPVAEVLVIARALLDVLRAAHAMKIVHRDIKPENVFVTCDAEIRVLDFGIARFFETQDQASVTRSGRTMGTPAFMAPEQAIGRIRDIDGQTDIWAVGATMFTLLSGRFVHEGESGSEVVVLAATRRPRLLGDLVPDVPAPIRAVIDRALSFDKASRWPDAEAMKTALVQACESALGATPSKLPRLVGPRIAMFGEVHEATTQHSGPLALRTTAAVETSAIQSHPSRVGSHSAIVPSALAKPVKIARKTWTLAGGVAVILALGAAAVTLVRSPNTTTAQSSAIACTTHVESSRNAWLDGNFERARAEANEALRIDGTSPQAHFAMLRLAASWPDGDDRSHFIEAQEGREALTPGERGYLEAVAPGMTVPPNFQLAEERLEARHRQEPADLEVAIALAENWLRVGRNEDALALIKPLAETADVSGIVLAELGHIYAKKDDIRAARETLRHCVASFPASSRCATSLAELEIVEGQCADAERVVRQDLEANPKHAHGYLLLAFALESQGASTEEIRSVLGKWAALRDGPGANLHALRAEFMIAQHEGRLGDALEVDARIAAMLRESGNDDDRFAQTRDSMLLKTELGMTAAAREALTDYTTRHHLRRDTYGGDEIMYLEAIATQLGLVAMPASRPPSPAATTATSEKAAVEALPTYLPMLQRTDRAFAACNRLENPIWHTRMLMQFAATLEDTKQPERACIVYRRVLERWPASSGIDASLRAAQREPIVCSGKRLPKQ